MSVVLTALMGIFIISFFLLVSNDLDRDTERLMDFVIWAFSVLGLFYTLKLF
jgi:hypothetical protein